MPQMLADGHKFTLSYSTNVHPARSVEDVAAFLAGPTAAVRAAIFPDRPAAVNLRLSRRMADALLRDPAQKERLDAALAAGRLFVQTINGFPILDFHGERVKEMVYSPPWTDGGRNLATGKLARLLADWLPPGGSGVVTVPTGAFKPFADGPDVLQQCAHFQTEALRTLVDLERSTGRTVRLGFEPEPFTSCETTPEFIDYYLNVLIPEARRKLEMERGMKMSEAEDACRRFLTVNLDLCHMACQFEDPAASIAALRSAGIAVGSIHVTSALEVPRPSSNDEGMRLLKGFDEPRYLHQVAGAAADGRVVLRAKDLPDLFAMPPERLKGVEALRVHFHVPLFAAGSAPLATTQSYAERAVRHALKLRLTDTMVIETYTWNVLGALGDEAQAVFGAAGATGAGEAPAAQAGDGVVSGIVREFRWFLETFGAKPA